MDVIANTIRRIPVQAVLPLILELTRMMQYRGHPNHSYAKYVFLLDFMNDGYLFSSTTGGCDLCCNTMQGI